MTVAASHLSSTGWTDNLEKVTQAALVGGVLGLALGYSRFPRRLASAIGGAYTAFFIPWQLGLLIQDQSLWLARLNVLYARLYWATQQFLSNRPVTDPLLFLSSMLLLFWGTSLSAGYLQVRYGRPWIPLIIGGVSIVLVDIYHPTLGQKGTALATYGVLSLLLVTLLHYQRNAVQWEQNATAVDMETEFTLGKWALGIALAMVLLAWNAANLTTSVVETPEGATWLRSSWLTMRKRMENLFAPLRGPAVITVQVYSANLNLGTGVPISEDVVFTARASQPRPEGAVYYWRAYTYNEYENGVWRNTFEEEVPFEAEEFLTSPDLYRDRANIEFTIEAKHHLETLYAPTIPLRIDRSVTGLIDQRPMPDVPPTETLAIKVQPLLRPGERYTVQSLIAHPTEADLRAAGRDYPDWIRERYLSVPIPFTFSKLAGAIAGGLDNPYDQVVAITQYLRENYTYSATIPTPPRGRDPILWFLFDLKRGFCNYYATAEVLLVRSLGIPARLAVGYAQGEPDPTNTQFTVRQKHSHAWPEVYFPGIGWVEFEPTSAQPLITRPSGVRLEEGSLPPVANPSRGNTRELAEQFNRLEEAEIDGNSNISPSPPSPTFIDQYGSIFLLGLALGALVYAVLRLSQVLRTTPERSFPVYLEQQLLNRGWQAPKWLHLWANYVRLTPMERLFLQVELIGRLLHQAIPSGTTPAEHIYELIRSHPHLEAPARAFLAEYEKALYSLYTADLTSARQALKMLWREALRLWLRWKPQSDEVKPSLP
ncbi:transglutaminase domain-containing protein [uncultured Thermanaerothrix sp.]|uniref:transglutaminase family protein n=1 Tax=uncultured Thermanaerothrix sp. TaxID=1195149 RepID=UPI002608E7D7|nr:transglutaminase domain-containing protein [uncultured Thermanaerothrix sp.]